MRGGSGKGVGSLLSLEGAINLEVERERRTHLTSLQRFEDLADAPQDVARTEVWGPEFWDIFGRPDRHGLQQLRRSADRLGRG